MKVGHILDKINNFLLQKDAHVASIKLHVFLLVLWQVQGHNQIMDKFIFESKASCLFKNDISASQKLY